MNIEKIDWSDVLSITRIVLPTTSQVNLSGVYIPETGKAQPFFSLAPGHIFLQYGKPFRMDRMLLADQSSSNELAALKLAWDNHNYEFEMDLSGYNPFIDIFPSWQYYGIIVNELDTPREFLFDGRIIIREINITIEQNEESNFLQISCKGENETFPGNSTNGDAPMSTVPSSTKPVKEPKPSIVPIPAITPLEPIPAPQYLKNVAILVEGKGVFYTNNFDSTDLVNWIPSNNGIEFPQYISRFEVLPDGSAYCQVLRNEIYYIDQIGSTWQKIFDTSMVQNPEGVPFYGGATVCGFGVNIDTGEIVITAGFTGTIFGYFFAYNYIGSGNSIPTLAYPIHFTEGDYNGNGNSSCAYSNGYWAISWLDPINKIWRFDGSFSFIYPPSNTLIGNSYSLITAARFCGSNLLSTNSTHLIFSQDSGSSWDTLTNSPTPYATRTLNYYAPEAFGTDPTGKYMLCGVDTGGLKRSADFGATWGITSIPLNNTPSVYCLGSYQNWLVSEIGKIYYTPDFGITFVDRTGDLQLWITALDRILQMRYFDNA